MNFRGEATNDITFLKKKSISNVPYDTLPNKF
jgi:hypothetical protein